MVVGLMYLHQKKDSGSGKDRSSAGAVHVIFVHRHSLTSPMTRSDDTICRIFGSGAKSSVSLGGGKGFPSVGIVHGSVRVLDLIIGTFERRPRMYVLYST